MCCVCQAVQSLTLLCDADGATPHSYPQSVDSCIDQVLGLSCSNHCSGQGETEMRLSTKEKNWQKHVMTQPKCGMSARSKVKWEDCFFGFFFRLHAESADESCSEGPSQLIHSKLCTAMLHRAAATANLWLRVMWCVHSPCECTL